MNDELIRRAASLARAAPREWQDFLGALRSHVDTTKDQCISSPLESLQVAQGRAQYSVALLRLFETCTKVADQMTEKRK